MDGMREGRRLSQSLSRWEPRRTHHLLLLSLVLLHHAHQFGLQLDTPVYLHPQLAHVLCKQLVDLHQLV